MKAGIRRITAEGGKRIFRRRRDRRKGRPPVLTLTGQVPFRAARRKALWNRVPDECDTGFPD